MARKGFSTWGRRVALLWLILALLPLSSCMVQIHDKHGESAIYALVALTDWSGANRLLVIQLRPDEGDDRFHVEHALAPDDAFRDPIVSTKDMSGHERAFLVNRQFGSAVENGSVSLLDQDLLFQVATTYPVNDGTPANPYDILVVNDHKAYVTRWDPAYNDVLIVDPDTGAPRDTIDFTGTGTNVDGLPRLAWIQARDEEVYVIMQNIDRNWNYSPGRVGIIDVEDDAISGFIALNAVNPGDAAIHDERMYIACTGNWWDKASAGLEVVNLKTRLSEGVSLSGVDLDGFLTHMAFVDEHRAFVVVNDGAWPSTDAVVEIDPADRQIIGEWYSYANLYVSDLAVAGKYLLIADNTGAKVVLMSLRDGSIAQQIATTLPPVSIGIWEGEDPL